MHKYFNSNVARQCLMLSNMKDTNLDKTLPLVLVLIAALAWLTYMIVVSSLNMGIFDAIRGLWPDLWFQTTIYDFYNNQLIIVGWIAYKEKNPAKIFAWLIFSLSFGSVASIIYILKELLIHKNITLMITETKRQA